MAGREKQKVFVYSKNNRAKLLETFNSIAEFQKKYLPHYNSKFPISQRDPVDLEDKLASLRKNGRNIYNEYILKTDEYCNLFNNKTENKKVKVINLKGEIIAEFINMNAASKIMNIDANLIHRQLNSNSKKIKTQLRFEYC